MQIVSIEAFQKKKKKQENNIKEIDRETWKKKGATRVSSN